jgi:hypothetical protein
MDNYAISKERAQRYFLSFDQEKLLRLWPLRHDENSIFITFLHRDYCICRRTGQVCRLEDMQAADYGEVLSIFDLLCHEGDQKQLSGQFAPVNSLNGCAKGAGVGTDFHSSIASRFDADAQSFRNACDKLGGTPVGMGDIGFEFPVFQNIKVILKFYHADEEFPASLTLLWDANMLQFVFYETVFYIAGCLLGMILEEMK